VVAEHEPVTGISVTAGRVTGVETERRSIAAPVVVDAAGGWVRQVAELAGASVPVAPVRHQLATGKLALTHEALDAWPRPRTVPHLRNLLISCGVLPATDKQLVEFQAWLNRRLDSLAGHPHLRLLRQFGQWHQLSRMRARAAAGPLRATAGQYARTRCTQAVTILTWAADRGVRPGALTQATTTTPPTTTATGCSPAARPDSPPATRPWPPSSAPSACPCAPPASPPCASSSSPSPSPSSPTPSDSTTPPPPAST
jgi:hypothetical protein